MPEPRLMLSVRVGARAIERIDRLAKERGMTRSAILRDALARGLVEMEEK